MSDDEHSPEEADRRMANALRAALHSPAKPHTESKLGIQHKVSPARHRGGGSTSRQSQTLRK